MYEELSLFFSTGAVLDPRGVTRPSVSSTKLLLVVEFQIKGGLPYCHNHQPRNVKVAGTEPVSSSVQRCFANPVPLQTQGLFHIPSGSRCGVFILLGCGLGAFRMH